MRFKRGTFNWLLSKVKTINSKSNEHVLDQLDEKWFWIIKEKIISHQNNILVREGALVTVLLRDMKYKLLKNTQYAPDWASSLWLSHIPNLKEILAGKIFLIKLPPDRELFNVFTYCWEIILLNIMLCDFLIILNHIVTSHSVIIIYINWLKKKVKLSWNVFRLPFSRLSCNSPPVSSFTVEVVESFNHLGGFQLETQLLLNSHVFIRQGKKLGSVGKNIPMKFLHNHFR